MLNSQLYIGLRAEREQKEGMEMREILRNRKWQHKVLLAFIAGLLIAAVPLAVTSFILSRELARLRDEMATLKGWTLTTDRTEYKLGETLKITFQNRFDWEIFVFTVHGITIEKKNENWEPIYNYVLPEYFQPGKTHPVCFSIANNTSFNFDWNQTMIHYNWTTDVVTYEQASIGQYRIKMTFAFRSAPIEFLCPEEIVTIYSNVFTIRP